MSRQENCFNFPLRITWLHFQGISFYTYVVIGYGKRHVLQLFSVIGIDAASLDHVVVLRTIRNWRI